MTISDPSRAHAHALYDLLTAALSGPPTGYQLYFGGVTATDADLTFPYLIVWPPPGARTQINLAGTMSALVTTIQVTAVGRDVDEVLAALDRAATALQGVRPALPGRRCGQIHQPPDYIPPPVTQSDTTRTSDGRPVYRGVAQYRLTSTPDPA